MLTKKDLALHLQSVYHNFGALCGKSENMPCGSLSDAIDCYVAGYQSWPSERGFREMLRDLQLSKSEFDALPEQPRHFSTVESECEMRVLALDAWHALVVWCRLVGIDPNVGTDVNA